MTIMRRCIFFLEMVATVLLSASWQELAAQPNLRPFWSLAGNNNATTTSRLGTINSVPLGLYTKNTLRISIDTLGFVGIGTTTPLQRLHVVGNGYFTGNVGIGAVPTTTYKLIVTNK